jgi:hypothetical protein
VAIPLVDFFLKRVQDVQDVLKPHGVDGPVRIAVEVIADFEDPAKTLEGLRVTWMIPKLRFKKSLPDLAANQKRTRGRLPDHKCVKNEVASVLGCLFLMVLFLIHTPIADSLDHDELLLRFMTNG